MSNMLTTGAARIVRNARDTDRVTKLEVTVIPAMPATEEASRRHTIGEAEG